MDSIVKELCSSPTLLKELYGDLAKPGVIKVGKAIESLLGLGNTILWPITLLNEKSSLALKTNLDRYREELGELEESEISGVAPEIGVPILERLAYVSNEDLVSMYSELLVKSSCINLSNYAHPSFVNILNNITPDEAVLLRYISNKKDVPFLIARLRGRGFDNEIYPLLTDTREFNNIRYPENISSYYYNLESLGIVSILRDNISSNPEIYEEMESFYSEIFDGIEYDDSIETPSFGCGRIDVTSFGKLFLEACVHKKRPNK